MPAIDLPDDFLRKLAELLKPHLDELGGTATLTPPTGPQFSPDYDEDTCRVYVTELGQGVLNRAQDFFSQLFEHGQIDSVRLAEVMNISTPRYIPANMTNSLKQRAVAMDLPRPWKDGNTPDGSRTVWHDRDGIAERMVAAIRNEQQRRHDSPGTGS